MAARRPFWKWHRWKSIGFCLWPPSTCIWNLKLKFQSKLDLCSGNHVVYRQTDGQTDRRTDGRTRWIQYTPPPTSLGGGIIIWVHQNKSVPHACVVGSHDIMILYNLIFYTTQKWHQQNRGELQVPCCYLQMDLGSFHDFHSNAQEKVMLLFPKIVLAFF